MTAIITDATAVLADCIHDEGYDLILRGYPIEYGEVLSRLARHCAEVLHEDGLLHGGGADSIERQRLIIGELRREIDELRQTSCPRCPGDCPVCDPQMPA